MLVGVLCVCVSGKCLEVLLVRTYKPFELDSYSVYSKTKKYVVIFLVRWYFLRASKLTFCNWPCKYTFLPLGGCRLIIYFT